MCPLWCRFICMTPSDQANVLKLCYLWHEALEAIQNLRGSMCWDSAIT